MSPIQRSRLSTSSHSAMMLPPSGLTLSSRAFLLPSTVMVQRRIAAEDVPVGCVGLVDAVLVQTPPPLSSEPPATGQRGCCASTLFSTGSMRTRSAIARFRAGFRRQRIGPHVAELHHGAGFPWQQRDVHQLAPGREPFPGDARDRHAVGLQAPAMFGEPHPEILQFDREWRRVVERGGLRPAPVRACWRSGVARCSGGRVRCRLIRIDRSSWNSCSAKATELFDERCIKFVSLPT